MLNVKNAIRKKQRPLYCTEAVFDNTQMSYNFGYKAVLFTSISRMVSLASSLDNVDPLFALVKTPGFYLYHVEVADQDPASGSL